jgi:hypothetical protein
MRILNKGRKNCYLEVAKVYIERISYLYLKKKEKEIHAGFAAMFQTAEVMTMVTGT